MYRVVVILSSLCLVTLVTFEEQSFKLKRGYKLERGTTLKIINLPAMSPTLCASHCPSSCGSATYSRTFNQCITFKEKFYDIAVTWRPDSDWELMYRIEQVRHGNWTLVFRAEKEVNASIYDVFGTTGRTDDLSTSDNTPLGCFRLDSFDKCSQHFRSSILDSWKNIDMVKFSIYTNGSEVCYIVFNGTISNSTSWFQKSVILESSWSSLKSDPGVKNFLYSGLVLNGSERRYTICGPYGSCYNDSVYFAAIDVGFDGCSTSWSLPVTSFPIFLYSPLNRLVTMSASPAEYKLADVLAIFVTFRN